MINKFRDLNKGKRCFILGSGPSISEIDLSPLVGEFTFCSNWFVLHDAFDVLNINFYCAYDPGFVSPHINDTWINALRSYDSIFKFFPLEWNNLNLELTHATFINFRHDVQIRKKKEFSWDPDQGFFDGGTVIINMCIPLAIYMGFKELILMGCETDYVGSENGSNHPYFYDLTKHTTPFRRNSNNNKRWQLEVLESYRILHQEVRGLGIRIFNATPGGSLDVFPRLSYSDVLNPKVFGYGLQQSC